MASKTSKKTRKDRTPEDYADLIIEAIPVAPVGDDEVVIGFQLWDQDDFDLESTLVVHARRFREVERVAMLDALLFDLEAIDGDVCGLSRSTLYIFKRVESRGTYGEPTAHKLPIRAARALSGQRGALWIVGGGVTRFDGEQWATTPLGKDGDGRDEQLTVLDVRGERAVAAGERGLVMELAVATAGLEPKRLEAPGSRSATGIRITAEGDLAVAAGRERWGGPAAKLARLDLPDGVESVNDVCEFRGRRYWAASPPGAGVYVEEEGRLVRVFSESCWHLTATERYLYASGEREVFRFDGERWLGLRIAYDERAGRWSVAPYEPGAKPEREPVDEEAEKVVLVVGGYDVKKPGALEKSLGGFFEQRIGYTNLGVWKLPKGFPGPLVGSSTQFSFAVGDGRCTFTLPLRAKNLEPLRAFLAKTQNLELRLGDASDVAKNEARATAILRTASAKPPKVVATEKGNALTRTPLSVTEVFTYVTDIDPAYNLTVVDGEVIGFGTHKRGAHVKGPQLNVITGLTHRTRANIVFPATALSGVSVGPDGVLHAGSDRAALYASYNRGRAWEQVPCPGLEEIFGAKTILATAWFEGELWAACLDRLARRSGETWTAVPLPVGVEAPGMYEQPLLVVLGGALYYVGVGVARWDAKANELVTELPIDALPRRGSVLGPRALNALAMTEKGTLLAGGSAVYRKPAGGAWAALDPAALGIDPDKPAALAAYGPFVVVGDAVVLVGNNESPHEQIYAVRVSHDDGATFRPLPIDAEGKVIPVSAVKDPEGGVLISGFGGALFRVTC